MEYCKRILLKLWKYRLNKSQLKAILALVILGTILYELYRYHCIEKITHSSEIQYLYTRRGTDSSIRECVEPSWEIGKPTQYLRTRVPKRPTNVISSKRKLVLLWTTYFGSSYSDDYCFFLKGNTTFVTNKCPVSGCVVTNDRSLLTEANAIVFHQSDIDLNDLPDYRSSNQIWIFYNLESPARIRNQWKKMNGLFNWTMTYREDSDIRVKYGEICRLPQPMQATDRIDYRLNKSLEVAWFVSDCYASSNRWNFVKELSKYINVDIYGRCGTKSCLPVASEHCYSTLLKNYKFYLSFENSICQDYVTEKFFNVLKNDIVPVVMGGANYERIAPPNSYINVFDYPNPRELAKYLKVVGQNSFLYNSYFEWKGRYKIYLTPWMCVLCEKLHSVKDDSSSTVISNMLEWWFEKAYCTRWYKSSYEFLDKCF